MIDIDHILNKNPINISSASILSCTNPTFILFYFITPFGELMRSILQTHGFDVNCSINELPSIFRTFTDKRQLKSYFCLKYNNKTMSYKKQFCNGNGMIYMSNCFPEQYNSGIFECAMPMLLHKTSLNTILTHYCNEFHSNDSACNFHILSYSMENTKERIEFLSRHINCSNNEPQHDKQWVFKEDKDSAEGIHFENNHKLIYKLISPNISEQNLYYKNCSNIEPFKNKKYIRRNGFQFNYTENGNGIRVKYKGLLMQQFISNPLLIENRAFHIRTFMLVPSYSNPFIVLHYKEGMLFRNVQQYNNKSLSKKILTSNGAISDGLNDKYKKKHGVFFKQIWGYHRFQMYLNEIYGNDMINYTMNKLQNDIKHIIKHVFNANEYYNNKYNYNENERGYNYLFNNVTDFNFYIYCMDIVITDQFELKLLEVNENCGAYCPGYWAGHDNVLDNAGEEWMCQGLVQESVDVLMETFTSKYYNKTIESIKSLNKFEIVLWRND